MNKDIFDYVEPHSPGSWRMTELNSLRRDGVKPFIFPTNKDTVMVDLDVILRDLNNELENY